jgi:hypothetical protein
MSSCSYSTSTEVSCNAVLFLLYTTKYLSFVALMVPEVVGGACNKLRFVLSFNVSNFTINGKSKFEVVVFEIEPATFVAEVSQRPSAAGFFYIMSLADKLH